MAFDVGWETIAISQTFTRTMRVLNYNNPDDRPLGFATTL